MKAFYLLLVFFCSLVPSAKAEESVTTSTKIFNQKIETKIPKGWHPVFENNASGHYMLEFVPAGQTKEQWSDMFTIQGFKGLAAKATPEVFLGMAGKMHQDLCGNQMVFDLMQPTKVSGFPSQSAIVGCSNIETDHPSGLKAGMSEVAYYTVVKGSEDIYLFHRAIRGNKFNKGNSPVTKENGPNLMADFMPIRLCDGKSKFNECLN